MWHGKQETEGILYLMLLLRMSNDKQASYVITMTY